MKTELTYNEAFTKLEELVSQIEDGNIQLDELSASVKKANELIAICETKLRNIDTTVKSAMNNSVG